MPVYSTLNTLYTEIRNCISGIHTAGIVRQFNSTMQSFYTSLDFQNLLKVSGDDNIKFLQGQLTCDLDQIDERTLGLGAACNNKGRIYTSFRILKLEGDIYLSMPVGVLENTRQVLQKFIPFYKAQMTDATKDFQRIGVAGDKVEPLLESIYGMLPEEGQYSRLDNTTILHLQGEFPRYELWLPWDAAMPDLTSLEAADRNCWQLLDLQQGLYFMPADDTELFTPEEANLDINGFVSFDKGCYTGQEIVARMHYRGKAGKRLFLVQAKALTDSEDAELTNSQGKALTKLSNALIYNNNIYGLAVLKTAAEFENLSLQVKSGQVTAPAVITPFL